MSTSTDGGLTWGPARNTADNATGIAGQPLVRKNGVVIVPIANAFVGSILYFKSTNGGASWQATKPVATIMDHTVAGGLRRPAAAVRRDRQQKQDLHRLAGLPLSHELQLERHRHGNDQMRELLGLARGSHPDRPH